MEAELEQVRSALDLANENVAKQKAKAEDLCKSAAAVVNESVETKAKQEAQVRNAEQKVYLLTREKERLAKELASAVEKEQALQKKYLVLDGRFADMRNNYDALARRCGARQANQPIQLLNLPGPFPKFPW